MLSPRRPPRNSRLSSGPGEHFNTIDSGSSLLFSCQNDESCRVYCAVSRGGWEGTMLHSGSGTGGNNVVWCHLWRAMSQKIKTRGWFHPSLDSPWASMFDDTSVRSDKISFLMNANKEFAPLLPPQLTYSIRTCKSSSFYSSTRGQSYF